MAYRNSKLVVKSFPAGGGGVTILERLAGGQGPAVNYVVKVNLIEVAAGTGTLDDGSGISIDLPAGAVVGSEKTFDFGDGYRLTGDLTLNGAGQRSGTVVYYTGV